MRGGGDGLELLDGDEGVDLRRLGVGVAKHLLDEAEVGAALEHERGLGVPKEMAGALLPHPGLLDVFADAIGEPGDRERTPSWKRQTRSWVGRSGVASCKERE